MQIKQFTPLLLALALTACGGETTTTEKPADTSAETQVEETETAEETTKEQSSEPYEITDLAIDESGYTPAVTGILKNTSGKEINYVQIEFAVKDADGNKIGNALANMNNLADGDTWKFNAQSFSTEEGQVIDLEDYEVSGF